MGLWDKLTGELVDIIEWKQESESDVMAWHFPRYEDQIKNGAQLIVREGQVAAFLHLGKLADVFTPGLHTLTTQNLPILSTLAGWKYGFNSPFKSDVYFISTRRFTDQKWGTSNPIMLRDKEFGPTRIRAFGNYAIQVTDPPTFLRQLVSTDPSFQTYEIAAQLRGLMVTRVTDALASSGIPVLDMAANLDELSKIVKDRIAPDFAEMGLGVPLFLIENISLPPNVEEVLDKRTSMGILGNTLDQYTKYQTANAIEAAAKNPAGGAAALGAGLGAGVAIGQQMLGGLAPQQPAAAMPPPLPTAAPWFAGIDGHQVGPLDAPGIQQAISSGRVNRETLVWREGMGAWTPAGQIADLTRFFGAVPPPLPPPLPK